MNSDFYTKIAQYYDDAFPLKRKKTGFLESFLEKQLRSVLDVGCATGTLSIELARQGHKVTGLDLDPVMVVKAVAAGSDASVNVDWVEAGMLDISERFDPLSFHYIFCMGNTLPHLPDLEAAGSFLKQCAGVLRPSGQLVIQTVNFNRVLKNEIREFPKIESENIIFERAYGYNDLPDFIRFSATMTVKDTGMQYASETLLIPMKKNQLEILLGLAGFSNIYFCGDFDGTSWKEDSPATIAVAGI